MDKKKKKAKCLFHNEQSIDFSSYLLIRHLGILPEKYVHLSKGLNIKNLLN